MATDRNIVYVLKLNEDVRKKLQEVKKLICETTHVLDFFYYDEVEGHEKEIESFMNGLKEKGYSCKYLEDDYANNDLRPGVMYGNPEDTVQELESVAIIYIEYRRLHLYLIEVIDAFLNAEDIDYIYFEDDESNYCVRTTIKGAIDYVSCYAYEDFITYLEQQNVSKNDVQNILYRCNG